MPLLNLSQQRIAQLAGLGYIGAQDVMPSTVAPQGGDAAGNDLGLPPQDLINSLYDIFGSYPRKNVLPYANGFTLAGSTQLAGNGQALPTIQTTSDAAHIITKITGVSTGAYTLMTIPVNSAAMVGTAELPFILPKPLMLAPNTTLSIQVVDISGQPNDIYFTIWGFKVYRRQYAAS